MSTDSLVLETLLEMKSHLGEIHGTMKSLDSKLDNHIADDNATAEKVRQLELAQAKERGARKVWAAVAGAIGGGLGLAVTWFSAKP